MTIDPKFLEIRTHHDPGFRPLVEFAAWRVAVLNHVDDLEPRNITNMQRHDETDEVFVLLRGRCILFIGTGGDEAGDIEAVDLAPLTLYNVKRGTWHNHTLSPDASVLVVENRETTLGNSPFVDLTPDQTAGIVDTARRLWSGSGP